MSIRTEESATSSLLRVPLLDIPGVADVLGITARHVQRLVAERRIPFLKVGRFIRFDPGELDVWLDQQRVGVRRSPTHARAAGR